MAEEAVAAAASPVPSDHKRKLDELEPDAPEQEVSKPSPVETLADLNGDPNVLENVVEKDQEVAAEVLNSPEAKRPRLEEEIDVSAAENGHQAEKLDEPLAENAREPTVENLRTEVSQHPSIETPQEVNNEYPAVENHLTGNAQVPAVENPEVDNAQLPSGEDLQQPTAGIPQQEDISSGQQEATPETQTTSLKMEVPNNKVGVLIGKAGETIRFLQYNSGAKIQITRDADADPYSSTRPVELIGSIDNVNKAEKLIKDVIAEAEAGGSPSLVARGFTAAQGGGATEQIHIQVPNEKVGFIIGKGGETIKNLQTKSGARIQLIPQHLPEGDQSKERTVRVTGNKKQIEMAREMIKEVMTQDQLDGDQGFKEPSISERLIGLNFSKKLVKKSAPALIISFLFVKREGSDGDGIIKDQLDQRFKPGAVVKSLGLVFVLLIDEIGEKSLDLDVSSCLLKGILMEKQDKKEQGEEKTNLLHSNLHYWECKSERGMGIVGVGDRFPRQGQFEQIIPAKVPVRPSPLSGGYNQQTYRPRGPTGPTQWGPRATAQMMGYDYKQRGTYPSQNAQYPPPSYGGYPPQQPTPRSSFNVGWDQRPPATVQAPPPQSGGYDYYGQGGHVADAPASAPVPTPALVPASAMGPPPTQVNYNYGQPQASDYGQPTNYSQSAPPQQSYGHGYDEPKYENQAPTQHAYGGHGNSQAGVYPQANSQLGYAQQPYGKPQSYGMPSQGPPPQVYGPPRTNQSGDVQYQGPISSTQSYGPNAPSQQLYPYASSGPTQQTYPYGSTPAVNDGYNQQPTAPASAPGYPQQGGQAVSSYGQLGGQPTPGYTQGGPAGGYGPYPSSQPAYSEQPVPNSAGYGYQGPTDTGYSGPGAAYGAPSSGQAGYVQPMPNQPSYDQSVPQPGGYGGVPGSAPVAVGYGKSLSPQPGYAQYDSTQLYGGHH
ncbi:hypothetical protein HHK36_004462 [Tetracentron sinense]|uniref:K Homology domain-containing protein n=1 Tax=Tetracentron sinense TaxID=13715 RepID=A0A835DT80_TETSI|nr:hypothetical protein HHK36_004462 [Tetracentron sinense]